VPDREIPASRGETLRDRAAEESVCGAVRKLADGAADRLDRCRDNTEDVL